MQIQLNGETTSLDGNPTIRDLVESLDLTRRRIAVEVNEEIVPRSQHSAKALADGDRVEIVHAIGGG
ncbi:sulfur carrier protein ThiS [Aidingimonas halophila]|uniref:Sulfur carrier protein ThiS n=1 Tax=Aidingimonas halophila TaxID=574349 RepID=A0A1H2Y246_9GAMM|nr:sulfur carrier protein ThiS [Aidingimonas halophila]GHC34348.1 sulfur carrier protein ThiS [Aidingimonas halophila]SDW99206.1 sulfur carrier protein ThiS [Aidingimonas halophila]